MVSNAIERMAAAIGYPDRIPEGSVAATLRVDGAEITASVASGRIILSQKLSEDARLLPELASFAAGRMMREEAVLSFGGGAAFLWQDAPADADVHALVRLFESFADSCDWWRMRVDEHGESDESELTEAVIRP